MENIQTDEETQPLAASPTRRVAEAYSHNDSRKNMKKCAYYIFIFTFLACIVSVYNSQSDSKEKRRAQKLRTKAEIMPEKAVQKLQTAIKKVELDEKIAVLNDAHAAYDDSSSKEEDDLEVEVENVLADVDFAEEGEIDTNNSMLTTAVKTMEDSIISYLGRVFGYGDDDQEDDDDDAVESDSSTDIKLTEVQLNAIARKISERLELDTKKEFRAKADSVKAEKKNEIKNVLEEDRKAKMNARDIAQDVREAGSVVEEDLKDEIDDVAAAVKDSLPERAKKIRDSVVEEVTGKKLITNFQSKPHTVQDDIENTKRAKTAKRKELRAKFEEMQEQKRDAQANLDSLKLNGGKNPTKVEERMKKEVKKAESDGSADDKSKKASKDSDDSADDKSKDSDVKSDDKSNDNDDKPDDKSQDSDDSADDNSKDSDDRLKDKSKDVERAGEKLKQQRFEGVQRVSEANTDDDSNEENEENDEDSAPEESDE